MFNVPFDRGLIGRFKEEIFCVFNYSFSTEDYTDII